MGSNLTLYFPIKKYEPKDEVHISMNNSLPRSGTFRRHCPDIQNSSRLRFHLIHRLCSKTSRQPLLLETACSFGALHVTTTLLPNSDFLARLFIQRKALLYTHQASSPATGCSPATFLSALSTRNSSCSACERAPSPSTPLIREIARTTTSFPSSPPSNLPTT